MAGTGGVFARDIAIDFTTEQPGTSFTEATPDWRRNHPDFAEEFVAGGEGEPPVFLRLSGEIGGMRTIFDDQVNENQTLLLDFRINEGTFSVYLQGQDGLSAGFRVLNGVVTFFTNGPAEILGVPLNNGSWYRLVMDIDYEPAPDLPPVATVSLWELTPNGATRLVEAEKVNNGWMTSRQAGDTPLHPDGVENLYLGGPPESQPAPFSVDVARAVLMQTTEFPAIYREGKANPLAADKR